MASTGTCVYVSCWIGFFSFAACWHYFLVYEAAIQPLQGALQWWYHSPNWWRQRHWSSPHDNHASCLAGFCRQTLEASFHSFKSAWEWCNFIHGKATLTTNATTFSFAGSSTSLSSSTSMSTSSPTIRSHDWRQTVLILLDGRMFSTRLPWDDGEQLVQRICATIGNEDQQRRGLSGAHHVRHRPAVLVQQGLECLLLQTDLEPRPSTFLRLVLIDLEIFELNEILPGAFRRFSIWLPETINRFSVFRLLGLESLLAAHPDRSRLWYNNVPVDEHQVGPLHLQDGDFRHVLIGDSVDGFACTSTSPSSFQENATEEEEVFSSFQVSTTATTLISTMIEPADVGYVHLRHWPSSTWTHHHEHEWALLLFSARKWLTEKWSQQRQLWTTSTSWATNLAAWHLGFATGLWRDWVSRRRANHVCDFPLHLAYNSASKHCDTPSSIWHWSWNLGSLCALHVGGLHRQPGSIGDLHHQSRPTHHYLPRHGRHCGGHSTSTTWSCSVCHLYICSWPVTSSQLTNGLLCGPFYTSSWLHWRFWSKAKMSPRWDTPSTMSALDRSTTSTTWCRCEGTWWPWTTCCHPWGAHSSCCCINCDRVGTGYLRRQRWWRSSTLSCCTESPTFSTIDHWGLNRMQLSRSIHLWSQHPLQCWWGQLLSTGFNHVGTAGPTVEPCYAWSLPGRPGKSVGAFGLCMGRVLVWFVDHHWQEPHCLAPRPVQLYPAIADWRWRIWQAWEDEIIPGAAFDYHLVTPKPPTVDHRIIAHVLFGPTTATTMGYYDHLSFWWKWLKSRVQVLNYRV